MKAHFLWQNLPSYAPDGVENGAVPASSSTPAPAPSPSPTPASSPAQSAVTAPESTPKAGAFDQLDGILDDDDTIVVDETLDPSATPAAVSAEGSPAPAPQATPPVDPKAVVPQAAPVVAPKEPASGAQPPPAASPAPAEPQGLVQQLDQHRDAVIAGLAAKEFALTKEEAEGLELDPAKTVTQLMAKTYYRATQSALLHIQNFVPQMVVSMVKALEEQKTAENAFYGKYPHLDRTKHAGDVNQFHGAFRSSNPSMKVEDLLAMVSAAVTAKHGLTVGAPQPANGHAPVPPQPRVPAFVPARPGAAVRVTPEPESAFSGLGQDFDD